MKKFHKKDRSTTINEVKAAVFDAHEFDFIQPRIVVSTAERELQESKSQLKA